jgi:hypothetical protein
MTRKANVPLVGALVSNTSLYLQLQLSGVLTKPDRIPRSEESKWLRIVRNESHPLLHGWYCVKHPDSIELASQLGWVEARSRGEAFFVQTEPWASLGFPYRQRLGTAKLTQKLSDLLYEAIKNR